MSESTRPGIFRWVCLCAAVIFCTGLLYLVWDLNRKVAASLEQAQAAVAEARTAVEVVNEQLPQIVEEVKRGTETLSGVAEDVELLKSVAGVQNEQTRNVRGLAVFASEIQQVLSEKTKDQEASILIEEIFGSDLKEVESAEEFLVGLSKELLVVILPFAKSKEEVLYRVCYSSPPRRKPFHIKFGEAEPVLLLDFIKQHHAPSAELPDFSP